MFHGDGPITRIGAMAHSFSSKAASLFNQALVYTRMNCRILRGTLSSSG